MRNVGRLLLAVMGVMLVSFAPVSEFPEGDKIILVDVEVRSPGDAGKCYSDRFDKKSVEIPIDLDHPFQTLDDYALAEEPLEGPDCFMPEMKVIFRTHTYVFSLYCTSVIKYRNSAPWTPSGKTVQSDIKVTESVLEYLQTMRKQYFGERFDPAVAALFLKKTKFNKVDVDVDDSDLYKDDSDDDKELEKEAIDKEGWFDDQKDPGLDDDETPDEESDDGGR